MLRKLVTYSEREEIKMKKLRVGIVGCGGIANQKHFPALKSQADKCDIVAFCDILIERAEKAAKEYGLSDSNFSRMLRCDDKVSIEERKIIYEIIDRL